MLVSSDHDAFRVTSNPLTKAQARYLKQRWASRDPTYLYDQTKLTSALLGISLKWANEQDSRNGKPVINFQQLTGSNDAFSL
jgi:hypothetical protein